MPEPTTATIDKLFLELAQFTQAKTPRVLELEEQNEALRVAAGVPVDRAAIDEIAAEITRELLTSGHPAGIRGTTLMITNAYGDNLGGYAEESVSSQIGHFLKKHCRFI